MVVLMCSSVSSTYMQRSFLENTQGGTFMTQSRLFIACASVQQTHLKLIED